MSAQPLVELRRLALAADPGVSGAGAQARAASERYEQADAALWPSVSFSGNGSHTSFRDRSRDGEDKRSFALRQYGLQLNQALIRPALWRGRAEAQALAEAATLQRDAAEDALTQQLVVAFFDVLTARSELEQLQAQKQATTEQLAVAKRSYQVGTVSVTDVREAEAKFDTVAAQAAAAELDLRSREEALNLIVGSTAAVEKMPPGAAVASATPPLALGDLSRWLAQADENSPQIIQARINVEAAEHAVSKERAARLPTLDLQVSRQFNGSTGSTVTALPQSGRSVQGGLTLNVPLYAGGGIDAKVGEALAQKDKAVSDFEAARRTVGANVRQAFFTALSAMARFKGLLTAERSAETALKANKRGYEVGMRINADVLNAQSQLFETRRDKARAWHEAWASFIKLKAVAGGVTEVDLAQIDALFAAAAPGAAVAVPPAPIEFRPRYVRPSAEAPRASPLQLQDGEP